MVLVVFVLNFECAGCVCTFFNIFFLFFKCIGIIARSNRHYLVEKSESHLSVIDILYEFCSLVHTLTSQKVTGTLTIFSRFLTIRHKLVSNADRLSYLFTQRDLF